MRSWPKARFDAVLTRCTEARICASAGASDANRSAPPSVNATLRVVRLNSLTPSRDSSSLMERDTAVGVTFNSSAARAKLKWRATSSNVTRLGMWRVAISAPRWAPAVDRVMAHYEPAVHFTWGHLDIHVHCPDAYSVSIERPKPFGQPPLNCINRSLACHSPTSQHRT